jgi:hypothetical protein
MAGHPDPKPRGLSTLCLPVGSERYQQVIDSPARYRQWLDQAFRAMPELFPAACAAGYTLKDSRVSAKRGLRLRRIRGTATGAAFAVRPSFVLPYLSAWTDDAEGPLFVRSFGVPFWALARVFGKGPLFWYRRAVGFGRNSVVGTTVRRGGLPEHLLADAHHQPRDGTKHYIATAVGAGCGLRAALAPTAGADDLEAAYGIFKEAAQNVQADYRPRTVNTDGGAATRQAWPALFPLVVILRCCVHGWLNIRALAKDLDEVFATVSEKVWHAYHAPDRRRFAQRRRRRGAWARQHVRAVWVVEQVRKLCGRARAYGWAYAHAGGQRTSAMLDRVMRAMHRYVDGGQHLHGSAAACRRHVRAWALLQNFRPWPPAVTRAHGGQESAAVRRNRHRYQDNWLHHLLVSASLAGYRR